MGLPGKETGVRQEIYPPSIECFATPGSIWAKPVSGGKRIEVSLRRRNRPDEVLSEKRQIEADRGRLEAL